jgi:hypothetical protein
MNPDPEKVGRGVCVRVRGCVGVGLCCVQTRGATHSNVVQ